MSGNGADLGAIYQAILALSADARAFRAEVQAGFDRVHAEIADLRQSVESYHGSVVGHGVLISELEERVSHLEARDAPQ